MSGGLSGLINNLEGHVNNFANRDDSFEKANQQLAKALGVNEKFASSVANMIEAHQDAEEAVSQLEEQIQDCDDTIRNLTTSLQDYDRKIVTTGDELTNLEDELSDLKIQLGSLTDAAARAAKQLEIDNKEREIASKKTELKTLNREQQETSTRLSRQEDRRIGLNDEHKNAENKVKNWKNKLNNANITDINAARDALKQRNAAMTSTKQPGKIAKTGNLLKAAKATPWVMAVDMLIKAVEFGIGKLTDYTRLNAENFIRSINATTIVTTNAMKANISSWEDAVQGAYIAQELEYQSQLTLLEAQNANLLASKKLANTWTNWIPIWGDINKYGEAVLETQQKIAEAQFQNAMKIVSQVNDFTKRTDDYIRKQDAIIHDFQRQIGLSSEQTITFENSMFNIGPELAKLNTTIEDAIKIQSQVIEQSGRAINFSKSEYLKNAAVSRLVGSDNLASFEAQMILFNHSVEDSADIMYQTYKDVNKMGLSQRKVTKDIVNNLKLANKYDFKNGTKGFIEFAKWAENARFNIQSAVSAAEKLLSGGLENAITTSAKLQVLGGGFSMYSDPLRMMYASQDPAEMGKLIKDMFSDLGTVDKDTGETTFNWSDNQRIRSAAEALGISFEDARTMIREDNKKEIVRRQMGGSTLSMEQQDAVINKAKRDATTGEWYVDMIGGGKKNINQIQEGDLNNIISNNNDEAAIQYAESTLSAVEQIESATKFIAAMLGEATLADFMDTTKMSVDEMIKAYTDDKSEIVSAIHLNRKEALESQRRAYETLGTISKDFQRALRKIYGNETEDDKRNDIQERFRRGIATNEDYDKLKENPSLRQGLTIDEMKKIRKKDTRTISALWDWHRDSNWVPGEEGDSATAYRSKKTGTTGEIATDNLHKAVEENNIKDMMMWGAINSAYLMKDGVMSGEGTPIYATASKVTAIHDGAVAQTDPKDMGLFAKSGGPFDKLFNGVFKEVKNIGKFIRGGSDDSPIEPLDLTYPMFRQLEGMFRQTRLLPSDMADVFQDSIVIPQPNIENEIQSTDSSQEPLNKFFKDICNEIQNTVNSIHDGAVAQTDPKDMGLFAKSGGPFDKLFNESMPIVSPISSIYEVVPSKLETSPEVLEKPISHVEDVAHQSYRSNRGKFEFGSPLKIELNGKLELTGSNGQSVDIMRELQNNPQLLRTLTQMISETISKNISGGKSVFNGGNLTGGLGLDS